LDLPKQHQRRLDAKGFWDDNADGNENLGGCALQGCGRIEDGGYAYFKCPHEMHIAHTHTCLSHAMLL
jgi:hypothetical protein